MSREEEPRTYERFRGWLKGEPMPRALVDLDALEHNADRLRDARGRAEVKLRIATKSLRHRGLVDRLARRPEISGLMTYSAGETEWLAEEGARDLLLGYPIGRREEADAMARANAAGAWAATMVDSVEQLDALAEAGRRAEITLPLCLDVDASLRWLGGRIHLGVRRSPIRSAEDALVVGEAILRHPHLRLEAVMAYEAQVAGLPDVTRESPRLEPLRRAIKALSRPRVAALRGEVVAALRAQGHPIRIVNGGGTGSVASTSADPAVTEVTAGSGYLCPHLFDGYRDLPLRPAAFFALPVVRRSDPTMITCSHGGYLASGPAEPSRAPIVHAPNGLSPLPLEGFGEVQTPFQLSPRAPRLAIGEPVICRHAKGGELAERFGHYLLVREEGPVGEEPTYRGEGRCFG